VILFASLFDAMFGFLMTHDVTMGLLKSINPKEPGMFFLQN